MTWFLSSLPWGLLALALFDNARISRKVRETEKERDEMLVELAKSRSAHLETVIKNDEAMKRIWQDLEQTKLERDKLIEESNKIPQCYLDLLDVHRKTIAEVTDHMKSIERAASVRLRLLQTDNEKSTAIAPS
jgi:hypothetical protein